MEQDDDDEEEEEVVELSEEEIRRLPRWAIVALAARAAMRVAPAYRPHPDRVGPEVRDFLETIDVCGTIAALSATQGKPSEPVVIMAAMQAVSPVVEAAVNEVSRVAAEAAGAAASNDTNLLVAAILKMQTITDALPTRADYDALLSLNLGNPGEDGRPVPPDFFSRPLWEPHTTLPENWRRALDEWQKVLLTFALEDVFKHHVKLLEGGGIDLEDATRRVREWASRRAATRDTAQQSAEQRQPSQSVVTPIIPNVDPAAKMVEPTPSPPAPAPERPDLKMVNDAPLEDEKEDRLDFKSYASTIAGLIEHPDTATPLTLSINAPWGSGKTSLAKMVRKRLESKAAVDGHHPHVTCWFNAWMHDDASNIASAFAAHVARAADKHRRWWRRLMKPLPPGMASAEDQQNRRFIRLGLTVILVALAWRFLAHYILASVPIEKLLEALDLKKDPVAQAVSVFGAAGSTTYVVLKVLEIFVKYFSSVGQSIASFIKDPDAAATSGSMQQVSDQLGELIQQSTPKGSRFVIFIDDLDRCRPPRSVEVLEVVNQLLGHPNVVIVIVADMPAIAACADIKYEAVAKRYSPTGGAPAGANGQQTYGRVYLQKIIQLQFDLPTHSEGKISELVKKELAIERSSAPEKGQATKSDASRSTTQTATSATPQEESPYRAFLPTPDIAHPKVSGLLLASVACLLGGLIVLIFPSLRPLAGLLFVLGTWLISLYQQAGVAFSLDHARIVIDEQISSGNKSREEIQSALPQSVKVGTMLNALIDERLFLKLVDKKSPLLQEAYDEVFNYIPRSPRNAKRLLNHLRLALGIAHERRMFEDGTGVTPRHIGKWIALHETFPELAQKVMTHPNMMEQLESAASDDDLLKEYIKGLLPGLDSDETLQKLCRSETKLGAVMKKIVQFDSTRQEKTPTSADTPSADGNGQGRVNEVQSFIKV